jgi:hypothetical protein
MSQTAEIEVKNLDHLGIVAGLISAKNSILGLRYYPLVFHPLVHNW